MLPDSADVKWVPTRGIVWTRWMALAASLMLLVIGGLIVFAAGTGPYPLTFQQQEPLIAILVVVPVLISIIPWLQSPQKVGLSTTGVTIVYPFRRVLLPWNDLMNVLHVTRGLVTFRPLSFNPKKQMGFQQVTFEQARAIFADPRCPQIILRHDQRQVLYDNTRPLQT